MIVLDEKKDLNYHKETYIALGSFDGLHIGHLSLIEKTISLATENNGLSMVFSFKNHPLTLVNKEIAPKLLMDNETKLEIIEKLGVDISCIVEFDESFMRIEPEEFIRTLVKKYKAKGIIVGFNYRFGYKNRGDIALLKSLSREIGFALYVLNAYNYKDEVVSSTRIRECISNGNIEESNVMLLRPYMLKGKVKEGKKIGRTIGFPTANLDYNKDFVIPKVGVYYTNVKHDSKIYKGITSVGFNPTVNGRELTVETNILDFKKNIYGDELKIYFIERIRNEKKFNSLQELQSQLYKDKEYAAEHKVVINS
ncbi:riboflavin biosynthesis protein [Clostridium polyendosporum]|uniref:Riboflavin biosynthesis protein n=1 Tax=Clostridium polyendosporum TaxID=69208 RepID=A0A919VFS3_9CLOT|nr:bifunctional riboflavin kinase/FAD synthetase [Clostridium polyendosporum]GIM27796.1 riboflavin biosynthesis protein [Clostridium polyendosporum]